MREDWVEIELGEILKVSSGKGLTAKNMTGSGYPVYGGNGVTGYHSEYLFDEQKLIIGRVGVRCGVTHITKNKAWVTDNALVVTFKQSFFDLRFMQLKLQFENLNKLSNSTAQPVISGAKIYAYSTAIPSLSEQRTIVAKIEELFSDLDKGIADLKKAQDQLVIFRQAVLKKAFAGELTKEWREQQTDLPTAEELLEQIKEERQNYFKLKLEAWKQAIKIWEENGKKGKKPGKPKEPKYFEDLTPVELKDFNVSGGFYTKMGNLSDIVRGGSPRPAGDERFYNGPIPFLKVADLTRKKGVYVDTYTYSIKEAGLQKTRMLDIGTLVISNSGATLGVPKITAIKATANDGIAAFLGLTESRSIFLYHYWNSKTLALRAIDQGAGQPNLNTDLLKAYPVPVFSDEEQHQILKEIESRLSVCDKVEQSITESLEKAKALRQSILKKAFEGTLLSAEEIAKCKAAKDYEPASVLLKKIKAETLRQAQGKKKKK